MKNLYNGQVTYYNPVGKWGKMKIDGEHQELQFVPRSQRPIIAGFCEPTFGHVQANEVPFVGAEVVVSISVNYRNENRPGHHIRRRYAEVTEWGLKSAYDEAKRIIAARPVYEAVQYILWNGKPTSAENQRTVINWGSAIGLQTVYPRGVKNDPLAPERESIGYTYRVRFYLNGKQVPDPRPASADTKPEKFRPTNEQGELLATAQEVATIARFQRQWEKSKPLVTA